MKEQKRTPLCCYQNNLIEQGYNNLIEPSFRITVWQYEWQNMAIFFFLSATLFRVLQSPLGTEEVGGIATEQCQD